MVGLFYLFILQSLIATDQFPSQSKIKSPAIQLSNLVVLGYDFLKCIAAREAEQFCLV